jgi:hypothetical protein
LQQNLQIHENSDLFRLTVTKISNINNSQTSNTDRYSV